MTWFAFKGYKDINATAVQEKELAAVGFHGYATESEADAHPNSVSILQEPLLESIESGLQDITSPVSAASSPSDLLGLPTLSNIRGLVIRSVKVIAGMLLIAIGFVKLLHIEDAAKDVAPVVAKGAMLA